MSAVPTALSVTIVTDPVAIVTVNVLVPTIVLRVHGVTVATPSAPVRPDPLPTTPPADGEKKTVTPGTGLPY